jgi:hypothetical protein
MNKPSLKGRFDYGKKIARKAPLSFGFGNAKLSEATGTFSLPAGWSCPFARDCLSKADRTTGRITDGKVTEFRCFAASNESTFPSVRDSRWRNYDALKKAGTLEGMAEVIQKSLPFGLGMIRVHVSGDFFNEKYFLAWLNVALNNPYIVFYGYTKALQYLVKYKNHIPANFRFTASKGGTHDHLIEKHGLKFAEVVYSVKEAEEKGLEIDHDDSHAAFGDESFALLLHGAQRPGTKANAAWKLLRKQGLGSYNETKKQERVTKTIKIFVTESGRNLKMAA